MCCCCCFLLFCSFSLHKFCFCTATNVFICINIISNFLFLLLWFLFSLISRIIYIYFMHYRLYLFSYEHLKLGIQYEKQMITHMYVCICTFVVCCCGCVFYYFFFLFRILFCKCYAKKMKDVLGCVVICTHVTNLKYTSNLVNGFNSTEWKQKRKKTNTIRNAAE